MPPIVLIVVKVPSYISLINLIYFRGTQLFFITNDIASLRIVSYTCFRSIRPYEDLYFSIFFH